MPRPRSIYERLTKPTVPPPSLRARSHVVLDGEVLISIATKEYGLQVYDPDLWRDMALANSVENPVTFSNDFLGKRIIIPAPALPGFI
jgi:nucleoid-associated protein YgaU